MIDQPMEFRYRGSESDGVIRLSASELACYRWPEDTAEHRAMRLAFMEGAASMASAVDPDFVTACERAETWKRIAYLTSDAAAAASAEVVQTQDDLGALLHAAEAEVERLRDESAIDHAIAAAEIERLRHDVERYMQIANDAINGDAQAPPNPEGENHDTILATDRTTDEIRRRTVTGRGLEPPDENPMAHEPDGDAGSRHQVPVGGDQGLGAVAQAPLNAKELIEAALRHADGITAQLAKPDWEPSRAHIKQARNSIEKLAGLLVQIVVPGS